MSDNKKIRSSSNSKRTSLAPRYQGMYSTGNKTLADKKKTNLQTGNSSGKPSYGSLLAGASESNKSSDAIDKNRNPSLTKSSSVSRASTSNYLPDLRRSRLPYSTGNHTGAPVRRGSNANLPSSNSSSVSQKSVAKASVSRPSNIPRHSGIVKTGSKQTTGVRSGIGDKAKSKDNPSSTTALRTVVDSGAEQTTPWYRPTSGNSTNGGSSAQMSMGEASNAVPARNLSRPLIETADGEDTGQSERGLSMVTGPQTVSSSSQRSNPAHQNNAPSTSVLDLRNDIQSPVPVSSNRMNTFSTGRPMFPSSSHYAAAMSAERLSNTNSSPRSLGLPNNNAQFSMQTDNESFRSASDSPHDLQTLPSRNTESAATSSNVNLNGYQSVIGQNSSTSRGNNNSFSSGYLARRNSQGSASGRSTPLNNPRPSPLVRPRPVSREGRNPLPPLRFTERPGSSQSILSSDGSLATPRSSRSIVPPLSPVPLASFSTSSTTNRLTNTSGLTPIRSRGVILSSHAPSNNSQTNTGTNGSATNDESDTQTERRPNSVYRGRSRPPSSRPGTASRDEAFARRLMEEEIADIEQEDQRMALRLSNELNTETLTDSDDTATDTTNDSTTDSSPETTRTSNILGTGLTSQHENTLEARRQRSQQFLRDLFTLMQNGEDDVDTNTEGATAAPQPRVVNPMQSLLELFSTSESTRTSDETGESAAGRTSGNNNNGIWILNTSNRGEDSADDIMRNPMFLLLLLMQNHGREASANRAIDLNDYESLWSLAEQLGDVKRRGITEEELAKIPSREFFGSSQTDGEQCRVCLTDYEEGEKLRTLSCLHEFHLECIDQWLQRNATCPICRKSLAQPT